MKIDNELTNLIKKALSEHEESYVEGAWENFVFKQKKRRRVLYWRISSSIAACLLLGLLFISIPGSDPQKGTPSQITAEKISQPKEGTWQPKEGTQHVTGYNTAKVNNSEKVRKTREIAKIEKADKSKNSEKTKKNLSQTVVGRSAKLIAEQISKESPVGTDQEKVVTEVIRDKSEEPKTVQREEHSRQTVTTKEKEEPGNRFDIRESEDIRGKVTKKKKVLLGINLSPGINSTSTGSSFNYSGGVNLEITLLPKLSLSTGVQIEHQTVETVNRVSNAAIPSDHMNANLTNLDIPINITWRFLTKGAGKDRYNYYVSGGVSSLAYMGERYVRTTYRQEVREEVNMLATGAKMTYQLENFATTSENKEEPLNAFNVAGRINLIFGVERKLTKDLNLHIEPYVKIPLSGLGSENMKFMTSGVTCKISF
ncbi:MAG: outer membrane beta-barrel protein [Rikenellaceae bacterium]|nr:outer membrane beta-barrel protein [Rikenellaceae bacterium]